MIIKVILIYCRIVYYRIICLHECLISSTLKMYISATFSYIAHRSLFQRSSQILGTFLKFRYIVFTKYPIQTKMNTVPHTKHTQKVVESFPMIAGNDNMITRPPHSQSQYLKKLIHNLNLLTDGTFRSEPNQISQLYTFIEDNTKERYVQLQKIETRNDVVSCPTITLKNGLPCVQDGCLSHLLQSIHKKPSDQSGTS